MEALAVPVADEAAAERSQWGDVPPSRFEDEELDILAFELWQRACCPEKADEVQWLSAADELWLHANCG